MIEKLVKILYFLERWGLSDRHREKILIWKYGDFHTELKEQKKEFSRKRKGSGFSTIEWDLPEFPELEKILTKEGKE